MKKTTIIACMLVAIASCNEPVTDTKSEAEKLMQTSRQWSSAAASKNVDSILGYWTDDAMVISANEPTLRDKKSIRQMVQGAFTSPGFQISWEPKSAEISKAGDLGYLLEDTKITMTDSTGKSTVENFEAVTIWKKQSDGSWKCVVDVLSPIAGEK